MNSLIHLIYASDASASFQEHEIPDLLKTIRPLNANRGITGMLLFSGTSFLQVLEGDAARVDTLFGHVKLDHRHERTTLIIREPILGRLFADWYMDFATVDLKEEIEDNSFTSMSPARAKRLFAKLWTPSWQKSRIASRSTGRAG